MSFIYNIPIRIRSKICVILYRDTEEEPSVLLTRLKEIFKVKTKENWKYLIKIEREKGCRDIIIYLKFDEAPDVYTSRFNLPQQGGFSVPSVWCFNEGSFALYSILRIYSNGMATGNTMTNLNTQELKNFLAEVRI